MFTITKIQRGEIVGKVKQLMLGFNQGKMMSAKSAIPCKKCMQSSTLTHIGMVVGGSRAEKEERADVVHVSII